MEIRPEKRIFVSWPSIRQWVRRVEEHRHLSHSARDNKTQLQREFFLLRLRNQPSRSNMKLSEISTMTVDLLSHCILLVY